MPRDTSSVSTRGKGQWRLELCPEKQRGKNDLGDQLFQFLLCKIPVASLGQWESRNGLGKQNVEVAPTILRGEAG